MLIGFPVGGENRAMNLDELKENFDVPSLMANRSRLAPWLKNRDEGELSSKIDSLPSDLSDTAWAEQVAVILGCKKKYDEYVSQEKMKLTDQEKMKLTELIRDPKTPPGQWVEIIRRVGYDDVLIPREELDRFKEAAKKK